MADQSLGSAWVDVKLRWDSLHKQASELPAKMSPMAAAEKKLQTSAKAVNDVYDERLKKVREFLGLQEKENATRAVALDRQVAATGQKLNRQVAAMQLSYAAQDFLTGAAMGNLNTALIGASNNLGVLVTQANAAAGVWMTLGLVAIPAAITALREFGSVQRQHINEAERLQKMVEQRRFGMDLDAKAREALTDEEVKQMHGAANLQKHVKTEERAVDDLNAALKDRKKLVDELEPKSRGLGAIEGRLGPEAPSVKRFRETIEKQRKAGIIAPPGRFSPATEEGFLREMGLSHRTHRLEDLGEKGIIARRLVDKDTQEQAKKQLETENKHIAELEEDRKKRESDLEKLRKRRDEEARTELQFQQRIANAGFNRYQVAKVELEKQEREERRQAREVYGKIVVRPPITEEELQKRKAEIDKKAADDTQANFVEMTKARDRVMIHGRRLTDKEQAAFAERDKQIEENRKAAHKALELEREPGTLLDPAMKALDARQRIRRMELAQEFTRGPRTTITGIADLYKHIQTGLGGHDTGINIQQKAADAAKATADATKDLYNLMQSIKNDGLKIQNGGGVFQ